MLTLFSIPKPFVGRIGDIQHNALRSWQALDCEVQVVLVGDEQGVAEAAAAAGVEHVAAIERSPLGTPRLDSAFAVVDRVARHPLRCFINADVVLLDDFLSAVRICAGQEERFLMIGECLDVDLPGDLDLDDTNVRAAVRADARARGVARGTSAIDYFVFPSGLFGEMPPFLVGRARFDNWLVWRARQTAPVIDATRAILAIHQSHDYAHLPGGKDDAYSGEEAAHNALLAGGKSRHFTLHDASHRLGADGAIRRNPGSILRARATAGAVWWKIVRRPPPLVGRRRDAGQRGARRTRG